MRTSRRADNQRRGPALSSELNQGLPGAGFVEASL